ncbi:MAG: DUF2259 domain-containing protein [Rhizobiaceae bacterium]|nr:DUF2259 domain-containing protein [Rhizobiaceae bacterium]
MRRLARVFALLLLPFAPARALAGDAASVEILGFTPDGAVFAFEEYGVQDGSGFPYASRYYIDTRDDSFLPGTPVRVTIEDEAASVADARAQAKTLGQKVFPDTTLAANRGHTAGFNAVTELSADPTRMTVNPRPVFPPVDDPLEFRLEAFAVEPPDHCQGLDGIVGFRLLKLRPVAGQTVDLRHEDERIPRSRGCPTGYRLAGIQTFYPERGTPAYAVLIAVAGWGFEGPNHRWIAATGRF